MSDNLDLDRLRTLSGITLVEGKEALTEASISRIMAHVESGVPFAAVTAFRDENTGAVNREKNQQMALLLRQMNLGFIRILGSYIEATPDGSGKKASQESFFVICSKDMAEDAFRRAMEKLGEEFGQDSVLLGGADGAVEFVYTSDHAAKPRGATEKLGSFSPTKIGDYFSEWKGRPFTFRMVEEGWKAKPQRELGFGSHYAMTAARKKYGAERQTPLTEASMSRIMAHVQSGVPFAILTAFRGTLSLEENHSRNKSLAGEIRSMNCGFIPLTGYFVEKTDDGAGRPVEEESLFVICNRGMSEEQFRSAIMHLGAKNQQDSVLLGAADGDVSVVPTTEGSETYPLGRFSPTKANAIYSEWKGRPFSFKELGEGVQAVETHLLNISAHLVIRENRKCIAAGGTPKVLTGSWTEND